MDREAWGSYSLCGCKDLDMTEQLSTAQWNIYLYFKEDLFICLCWVLVVAWGL